MEKVSPSPDNPIPGFAKLSPPAGDRELSFLSPCNNVRRYPPFPSRVSSSRLSLSFATRSPRAARLHETFERARSARSAVIRRRARGRARHIRSSVTMDESGVDMGFDLTTALAVADPTAPYDAVVGDYDDEFEQALSLLSTSTKELMYYELKSRAPDTGRYVISICRRYLLKKEKSKREKYSLIKHWYEREIMRGILFNWRWHCYGNKW